MAKYGAGKSPLDQFLPESAHGSEVAPFRGDLRAEADVFVAPDDVHLDPIEGVVARLDRANSSSVQVWPMLAAALVAIGVSMLALAAFARLGFPPL